MNRALLCLVVAMMLAVSWSCASGGGSVPDTHYYTLRPSTADNGPESGRRLGGAAAPVTLEPTDLVVGVGSIMVDPPYDQERLVFRNGADTAEVGFYHYHRWAAPLGRLIATGLAEGLRGTPGISAIEPSSSGGDYSARLDGRLIYLEEVDHSAAQEVRLAIDLELRDRDGASLWTARLSETARVDVETVPEIAAEVQLLFERLLDRARSGIAAALKPGS